jgi:hypothetical protein
VRGADEEAEDVGLPSFGEDVVAGMGLVADRHTERRFAHGRRQPALRGVDDLTGDGSELAEFHAGSGRFLNPALRLSLEQFDGQVEPFVAALITTPVL